MKKKTRNKRMIFFSSGGRVDRESDTEDAS